MTTYAAGADVNAPAAGEQGVVWQDAEALKRSGIKRFLLTLPTHGAVLLILAIGVMLGVVRPVVAAVMALLIGCALPVFYGLLRSGVMVRSRDPLLAFSQVLFNLFLVALGYALFDGLRSTVLLWLSVIIVFDMRRLPTRQVRAAAAFTVLSVLVATVARAWWHPSGLNWVHELFTALLLAVVLPVLIAVSGQARAVRKRHLRQKEQMAQTLDQLRSLSVRDSLTGLFNRRHMLATLEAEVRRCERSGQPFWVAIIDLDLFKQINDRFGHGVGDTVLHTFGVLAQGAVPGLADMFARWGGEEFLVLQTSRTEAQALDCLLGLRQAVQDYDWTQHAPGLSVSFSAGVCEHRPGQALDHTLERADQALYRAKAEGRDRIITATGVTAQRDSTSKKPGSASIAPISQTWPAASQRAEAPAAAAREPAEPSRRERLLNALLGPHVKLRTSQYLCLMSAFVYLCCIAGFLFYIVPAGLLTPAQAGFFVAHNVLAAVLPSALLRVGVTANWRDPGLVLPQIVWGGFGGIVGHGLMPITSTSTLQLICLALVFGFSSLRPAQARWVGGLFIGMLLCVLVTRAWVHPAHFNPQAEVLETAMTCLVLWLLTLLSYNFGLMRESVRAEKSELSEAAERVNQMMMHDALTGLHNRRQMQELLARECERQQRMSTRWCVALIDLDHFKHINDTYGHRVGDDVLIGFAKCAQTVLRETDMVCRWGGEEFLVLLADTEPGPKALLAVNRLREHVAAHVFGAGPRPIEPIQVTFSAGLAEHLSGEPIAATLERADKALYAAKAAGRNRCVMADHSEPCEGRASQRPVMAQTPSRASLSF